MNRREQALAEIALLHNEWAVGRPPEWTWLRRWKVAVLEGHKATLERHRTLGLDECRICDETYPCPDAAHVLDLYAPEVKS